MTAIILIGTLLGVYFYCFKEDFNEEIMAKLAIIPFAAALILILIFILSLLGV